MKKQERRRRNTIRAVVILIVLIIIVVVFAMIVRPLVQMRRGSVDTEQSEVTGQIVGADLLGVEESGEEIEEAEIEVEPEPVITEQDVLDEAELLAAMYDYDGAISTLQESEFYDTSSGMQSAVTRYQEEKDACVAWEPENVTHIFYHTLIVDPSKAFDGDAMEGGYNQYMCTIDEFNKITQIMYDEGYVMVSMHDMCTVNEDGTVDPKEIYLPEGKIPFVLSQDDVSYYHYMSSDGFAQKLIIDEDGKIKNTYVEDDGTVSVGDYDLVPLIDDFVEEHPDFSYHGHKGTIALTGYEGVLGYRTDEVYRTKEAGRVTSSQQKFFDENPDFDEAAWQNEVDQATAVANAMKEEGWEFASHTWGHIDPLAKGYDAFVQDTDRWVSNVEPIVGDTDIIIFAFGADITDSEGPYTDDNAFFRYLKEEGFDIYCLVDASTKYFVQFGETSMRMGRRNIDGYRMYYSPERLEDLFTVSDVWDDTRPTPVPQI